MYNGPASLPHLVLIPLDLRTLDCGQISGLRGADTVWTRFLDVNHQANNNQDTQIIAEKIFPPKQDKRHVSKCMNEQRA